MTEEMMQEDIGQEEVEQDQYLIFTVKLQEFGIQAVRVQEISKVLGTTQVPNAPTYFEGIVNLQGRLASVINFRKKFGFETKEHDEETRIIIAEHGGFPIGIVADSVEEVIKIPREAVQNLPDSISTLVSQEYIAGVAMLERRLIVLLDVDKVLTKTELIEVGAVTQP
jgi:purine-binding chemotaxis protein CheW